MVSQLKCRQHSRVKNTREPLCCSFLWHTWVENLIYLSRHAVICQSPSLEIPGAGQSADTVIQGFLIQCLGYFLYYSQGLFICQGTLLTHILSKVILVLASFGNFCFEPSPAGSIINLASGAHTFLVMALHEYCKSAVTVTGLVFPHCFFCFSADAGSCSLLATIKSSVSCGVFIMRVQLFLCIFVAFYAISSTSNFNPMARLDEICPCLKAWLHQVFWNGFPVDVVSRKTSSTHHSLCAPYLPISSEKQVILRVVLKH